jgi:hypothetical protein
MTVIREEMVLDWNATRNEMRSQLGNPNTIFNTAKLQKKIKKDKDHRSNAQKTKPKQATQTKPKLTELERKLAVIKKHLDKSIRP